MKQARNRGSRLHPAMVLLALVAGCQSYEPEPLDPEQVLKEIAARRESAGEADVLSLPQAALLLREHGPRVREARAAHATAQALADVDTPLPNPTLGVGPLFFSGAEILGASRWGVEAALGWSVLLGGKRGINDDLNDLRAEAAYVHFVGVEREEYLALRRDYAAFALAVRQREAREELEQAVLASVAATRRRIDAAQGTALDLRQLQLEAHRARTAVLGARVVVEEWRGNLAGRTGIIGRAFQPGEIAPLPEQVPGTEALRELLLTHHPGLARLRAEYMVVEKELRREIAEQFPDLAIGVSYEQEPGTSIYGLPLGIDLPIFDRNQQGIAEARARRQEVRVGYEAQAARSLAEIDVAYERLLVERERHRILREEIRPSADASLRLARRALDVGASDALQFLDLLRLDREIRIEALEAEQAVYAAWCELEQACGAPLLLFPELAPEPEETQEQ